MELMRPPDRDSEAPRLPERDRARLGGPPGVTVDESSAAQHFLRRHGAIGGTVRGQVLLDPHRLRSPLMRDAVLAHELAHAQQQAGAPATESDTTAAPAVDRSAGLEADADRAALATLATGRPHSPRRSANGLGLQRCAEGDTSGNVGRGAITTGVGALGVGLGVLIIASGPVGWVAGLSAAMLLSSGIAGVGIGTVHMATAGTRTAEQDQRLYEGTSTALSLASGPGSLAFGTVGAMTHGEEGMRTGAMIGGFTEAGVGLVHGGAMTVIRVRRFNALAAERNITDFSLRGAQGDELRAILREVYGTEQFATPNPAFRGGVERLEMSHAIPDRQIRAWVERLRASGHTRLADDIERLGVSPLNIMPMSSLEHALVDDMAFQFMRRGHKPLHDNPFSPWVSPRANAYSPLARDLSPLANLQSLSLALSGTSARYIGPVRWMRVMPDSLHGIAYGTARGGLVLAAPSGTTSAPAILPLTGTTLEPPLAGPLELGAEGELPPIGLQIGDPVLYLPGQIDLGSDELLMCIPTGDLPETGEIIGVE